MRIEEAEFVKIEKTLCPVSFRGNGPRQIKQPVVNTTDAGLFNQIVAQVMNMGDRDELVQEVKDDIMTCKYKPCGNDVVEAMIRRTMADRIR